MTLDQTRLFHHGIVVDDIAAAAETLTREQGLTFSNPWTSTQTLRVPGWPAPVDVELTIVYSGEGPVHVELVQKVENSVWQGDGAAVLHHVGYWSDDLVADGLELEAGGYQLVFENVPEEGQTPTFRYYLSGLGLYLELVHTSVQPLLEQLWASTLAPRSTQSVQRTVTIDAPAEVVWAALRNFNEHDAWMEAIAQSADFISWSGEPNQPGVERRFTVPGQPVFAERLVRVDDDARELAYSIVESPLAIDDHESTVAVVEDGAGSVVTWTARFVSDDGTAAMLDGFMGGQTFEPALAGLKAHSESATV